MNVNTQRIAVIGGGLAGITAAIDMAKQGIDVDLYEAAPHLGGRTQSFFHKPTQSWVDHGPHLLIGAYHHTIALLKEIDAFQNTRWQKSLNLPLWEAERGHFSLHISNKLPFSLALMQAIYHMPGHGFKTLPSLLRMAYSMKKAPSGSVLEWMEKANIHTYLQRDLLEILCLGAMNENMATASAASFSNVLQQAFANHKSARLGWFTQPLSQALIQPLQQYCETLGVNIHTSSRVLSLQSNDNDCAIQTRLNTVHYDKIILTCSPSVRNTLLGVQQHIEGRSITNIHLWFDQKIRLNSPFIGGIGTYGQWFFDISHQFNTPLEKSSLTHLCAVISADESKQSKQYKINTVLKELRQLTKQNQNQLQPLHQHMITVHTATHLVRPKQSLSMPKHIIDACEQPHDGELPATIESAISRGKEAAIQATTKRN